MSPASVLSHWARMWPVKLSLSRSKIDEANEDSFSCFVLFYAASVLMLYMCSLLIGWTTVS